MAAPAHIARENGKKGGRPKGSTNRPTIFDYWDKKAIAEYFEFLQDNYKEDSRLMVFVGEQLMGKATQAINFKGDVSLGLSDQDRQRLDALLEE